MGSEGVATLTADPNRGIAVRKLYDPQGVSSREMIQRKHQAGKSLVGEQSVAQYKGQAATPRGGGTMQFSEYVPGTGAKIPLQQADATGQQAYNAIAQRTPFSSPQDIRSGNMVMDSRTGKPKVVDFMPMKSNEIAAGTPGRNVITPTPQGARVFNPNRRDFSIGQGLPNQMANRLDAQQSAHLKQQFLGRGPVQTPAVSYSDQMRAERQYRTQQQQRAQPRAAVGTPGAAQAPQPATAVLGKPTPAARTAVLPKGTPPMSSMQRTAVGRKPKMPATSVLQP
jgi:hypothetical protein